MISQEEIAQMPINEKIMAIESLWRSLSNVEEDVEVPQWHKDILDDREEKIQNGEASFIPWEEAKRQINSVCK